MIEDVSGGGWYCSVGLMSVGVGVAVAVAGCSTQKMEDNILQDWVK